MDQLFNGEEHKYTLKEGTKFIVTVSLEEVEASFQDREEEKQKRFDFNIDLKSEDALIDTKLELFEADEETEAAMVALMKVLEERVKDDIANGHTFNITSFYLNNDTAKK